MLLGRPWLEVHLFDHGTEHGTPDAVFPNNWHGEKGGGRGGNKVHSCAFIFFIFLFIHV